MWKPDLGRWFGKGKSEVPPNPVSASPEGQFTGPVSPTNESAPVAAPDAAAATLQPPLGGATPDAAADMTAGMAAQNSNFGVKPPAPEASVSDTPSTPATASGEKAA